MVVAIFTIIISFISAIFVTGLFGYHTMLVSKNTTTKEELKFLFKNIAGNPYAR